jgi:hypothetical protein
MFVVFICRTVEAQMFDDLQDLEEQDFEQLGGGKCPRSMLHLLLLSVLLYQCMQFLI